MTDLPVLVGPRITLRPLRRDDASALFDLARDPKVTRHLSWPSPQRVEDTAAFIDSVLASDDDSACHLCIALREGDQPIGVTSLVHIDRRQRNAIIGSWIGVPHWSKGLMRESKALLLSHAFDTIGLERVHAWVQLENQRSLSSLEACGFRREGVARRFLRRGDRFANAVLMAILRDEHRPLVRQVLRRRAA